MKPCDIAWRGFVTHSGEIIAWPTLLVAHNDFHAAFYTSDEDFAARWRQWAPGGQPSIDPGAPQFAVDALMAWLP